MQHASRSSETSNDIDLLALIRPSLVLLVMVHTEKSCSSEMRDLTRWNGSWRTADDEAPRIASRTYHD